MVSQFPTLRAVSGMMKIVGQYAIQVGAHVSTEIVCPGASQLTSRVELFSSSSCSVAKGQDECGPFVPTELYTCGASLAIDKPSMGIPRMRRRVAC